MRFLTLLLAFSLLSAGVAVSDEPIVKPHIVLIMLDDMGYGDPGCYNSASKIPTPNIDRLAQQGMKFTDAHAPGPLCHMSRYGLLTGRFPFRIDVNAWRTRPLIEEGEMTIASLAASQGYQTAMVGKWHCGFDETNGYESPLPGGPVDRGFDSYFGTRASTDIPPYFYIRNDRAVAAPTERIEANASEGWSPIQGAFWREGGIAPDLELESVTPRFTDEAIAILAGYGSKQAQSTSTQESSDTSQPLMLYLAYPSPHTPWLPDEEFRGRSGAGMYGDFMMMVDAEVGRVIDALDRNGLADDALVILTADNGPVWYEQDVARFGHDSAGPLRGMKADAWEAGHRMPFIVRWPGKVQEGTTSEQTICFTDLLATFAEILSVPLPTAAGPDSFSFASVLHGEPPSEALRSRPIVMSPGGGTSMMTVREGDWKLIRGLGSGGFSNPKKVAPAPGEAIGQLYNLREDLAESNNLYSQRPEVVAKLLKRMGRVLDQERSRPE